MNLLRRTAFFLAITVQVALGSRSPKLLVIISLDQFPNDYIERFHPHFGRGGFTLLMDRGAYFANATYKHALNLTGPGHAAIGTGCYGNVNGIFANDWYSKELSRTVYCVEDPNVQIIGASSKHGVSPANLLVETIGDELKRASPQSKVISVSAKDRSAILMGGKQGDAAYWWIDSAFVSSTYYMKALPEWVSTFNRSGLINSFFGATWEKALPEEAYRGMDRDDAPYEDDHDGLGRAFPHRIHGKDSTRITSSYYSTVKTSPFGDRILLAFALEAFRAESLGTRGVTDLLWINLSSNDYVGHGFGPHSHEVLDMAVRTDRLLADLFASIDSTVGLSDCIIALTSDHGVAPIPEYLLTLNPQASAGRVKLSVIQAWCRLALTGRFGEPRSSWYHGIVSNNIYLNREALKEMRITPEEAARVLVDSLGVRTEIAAVFTRADLLKLHPSLMIERRMKNSFCSSRSGDVVYALRPYYFESDAGVGTTHGEPHDYDAHVPLIIMGNGVRHGRFTGEASPADLAPTLAEMLGIPFPAGRQGRVLRDVLE
jgi:predicted AlkP superfamily pyrophosphatase or phosphodiesterase